MFWGCPSRIAGATINNASYEAQKKARRHQFIASRWGEKEVQEVLLLGERLLQETEHATFSNYTS